MSPNALRLKAAGEGQIRPKADEPDRVADENVAPRADSRVAGRRAPYLLFGGVILLAALAIYWHVSVPVL